MMCWFGLAIGLNAETDTRPPAVRQRQIRVVDADNRPVAGAAIEGETIYPWGPTTAANARAEWHGVTDAQGRASFKIDGLPQDATLELAVDKPGLALDGALLRNFENLPYRAGQTGILLALVPATGIEGRVVDETTGAPIASARVIPSGAAGVDVMDLNIEAATDAGGRFEIKGLPVGWRYRLDVSAAGYGNRDRNLDAPEADPHRLEVEPIELVKADRPAGAFLLQRNVSRPGATFGQRPRRAVCLGDDGRGRNQSGHSLRRSGDAQGRHAAASDRGSRP